MLRRFTARLRSRPRGSVPGSGASAGSSVPKHSSTASAGMDETDFGFGRKKNLHQIVRDSSLTVDELVRVLRRTSEDVNAMDLVTENYGPIHALISSHHNKKVDLLMAFVVHSSANIDLTTTVKGSTALHLAIENCDLEISKVLIALGANLNVLDLFGKRSPLDIARLKAKEKLPIPDTSVAMDTLNRESAPLQALELSGATKTPRRSNSSKFDEIVSELESVGALPGLQCLAAGASPVSKATPSSTGESTHVHAVDERSSDHRRDELTRSTYYRTLDDSIDDCLNDPTFEPTPAEALQLFKRMQTKMKYRRSHGSRILCLGGGAIRGLVQIEILREIERRTGKAITDLFDWIVGTSTGGVIALALVYGGKTPEELRRIYLRVKDDVFSSKGILCKGNSAGLKAVLQDWLGTDTVMSDKSYPKVLIPAVYKAQSHLELHFFNNCFDDEYANDKVWKVAYRTSAAPFYFKEEDNYIDGGLLANNPCEEALTAIQQFYQSKGQKLPISLLVSVGSGINPPKKLGSINFGLETLVNRDSLLDFLEVLESAVLSTTAVHNCESRCKEQGIRFFHFNPTLAEKVESNETSNAKLLSMMWAARVYMHQEEENMRTLVSLLKQASN